MIDYFLRPSTFYDMPFVCFDATINVSTHWKHAKGMSLRYSVFVFSDEALFFMCVLLERLIGGGLALAELLGGEAGVLLEVAAEE